MIIQSKNFSLKLEEILIDEIPHLHFNQTEKNVIRLVKDWFNGKECFKFNTSGSTGKPKEIDIQRDKIIYSTNATFNFIDPDDHIKSCLLCIDPSFVGGAMVVFRALIKNLDLFIIEPTMEIMKQIPVNLSADLVSMVPAQYHNLDKNSLDRFGNVLIGGGPMGVMKENHLSNVYSTYGMTETISHVALRLLHEQEFKSTGDTEVRINNKGCLEFKGTITSNRWLSTNDLGTSSDSRSFKWIGRKDFIINSGGIKFNPEIIEQKLVALPQGEFLISSIPDKILGERIVLLLESKKPNQLDFSLLDRYEIPKEVFENVTFLRTPSEKIDRIKTRDLLISSL